MILVGTKLYGYCNGYFGRDSYDTKRIEAVGTDWIVAREDCSGAVVFAEFNCQEEMEMKVKEWSSDEEKLRWEDLL